MSEHHASIEWKRKTPDFSYETYDRTHRIIFGGGTEIAGSAAPEYKGTASLVNPEEALVAALSSCHMLTFLAVAAKSRLVVDTYSDAASGYLEKNQAGKMCIARVILRPKVTFFGGAPSSEKLSALHESAHRNCFIANSVSCDVRIEE